MMQYPVIVGLMALGASVFSCQAASVTIPQGLCWKLTRSLPAAVAPMPASNARKIHPLVSEKSLSIDRTLAVAIGEEPYSMTAVSAKGRAVELSVPVVKNGEKSYTNRWFKAEDVFGGVKWDVKNYKAKCQNLLYFARGKEPVDLVARLPKDDKKSIALGRVVADGKADYRLLLCPTPDLNDRHRGYFYGHSGLVCGVTTNKSRIVLAREAPPVKTKAEYDKRVEELLAEYAFREGRPWSGGFRPLLSWSTRWRNYDCAAFANDFAMYVFGKMYGNGEPFSEASDIRAGDYIDMDSGHKFIVLYRDGGTLHTIEGNLNKVVSRSKSRYYIKDGKLFKGQSERKIAHAFHLFDQPGKRKKK